MFQSEHCGVQVSKKGENEMHQTLWFSLKIRHCWTLSQRHFPDRRACHWQAGFLKILTTSFPRHPLSPDRFLEHEPFCQKEKPNQVTVSVRRRSEFLFLLLMNTFVLLEWASWCVASDKWDPRLSLCIARGQGSLMTSSSHESVPPQAGCFLQLLPGVCI